MVSLPHCQPQVPVIDDVIVVLVAVEAAWMEERNFGEQDGS